jgi:cell division protein FtsA
VVVGLDLGTTKIGAVIAEAAGDQVKVIGVGTSPSGGLRRGMVIDVEKTVQAVRKAMSEAELMAGVQVTAVYAGIAGEHITSRNSRGVVAVSGSDGEITAGDKERVIEAARAVSVEGGRQVLHVLPQEFSVDEQGGIRDPVGIAGVRLEAGVHLITGSVTSVQNISKSILRAGYEVREVVLAPLASSYAVVDEDEREMGVCLIDIGGGTTDVALYAQGSIHHTRVIGLGGQNVTNDVAIGLRTSWSQAEHAKCAFGLALAEQVPKDERIEVPGVAGRQAQAVPRRRLAEIIEVRMEEILGLIRGDLHRLGMSGRPGAGVVLTGGGSLLAGIAELAERVFDLPVRLGVPRRLGGMSDRVTSPIFSTALGLVLFGMEDLQLGVPPPTRETVVAARGGWWRNVREWIDELT